MNDKGKNLAPEGIDEGSEEVARRLCEARPEADPVELDRVKSRAMRGSRQPARRQPRLRGVLAPARLAMVSLLAGAFMVAGSGATLAVSGISSSGSAGLAQYARPLAPPEQEVAPDEAEGGDELPTLGDNPAEPGDDQPTQAVRQVESGGDAKLPFTGLAAAPVLLIGCGLLVAGAGLRRRTGSERS